MMAITAPTKIPAADPRGLARLDRTNYEGEYVRTVIVCSWPIGFGLARMYEALMEKAVIQVRSFRDRTAAADWLGVPEDILCRPPDPHADLFTDLINPAR